MNITKLSDVLLSENLEKLPTVRVPIDKLVVADSPRGSGEDPEHVHIIAASQSPLPPILVHHPTMRVLDGIHRLQAARLRGEHDIEARLFKGDEATSFVLAVHANTTHGLPLSLADRKDAARRILHFYPDWSDRAIAMVTGITHQTVAALRERPTGQDDHLVSRIGRDGRRRPRDNARRRDLVKKILAANPNASLREIARRASVSPETVRSVRASLTDGGRGGPEPASGACPAERKAPAGRRRPRDDLRRTQETTPWQALRADPAFRSSPPGQALLRMLSAYQALQDHCQQFIDFVPPHCTGRVAAAARACAAAWEDFADQVERHGEHRKDR